MLSLKRTIKPGILPVTTDEFKTQARVDYIRPEVFPRIGASAVKVVENLTRRSLITQTWAYSLDGFPCGGAIFLPRGPVQSVVSVKYLDKDAAEQTFSSSNYRLTSSDLLVLKTGSSWPTVYSGPNTVTVTYNTGYGSAATDVPDDLKHAVLMLSTYYYDNPSAAMEGERAEVPFAVRCLISDYRNPYDPEALQWE